MVIAVVASASRALYLEVSALSASPTPAAFMEGAKDAIDAHIARHRRRLYRIASDMRSERARFWNIDAVFVGCASVHLFR